jgi:glutamate N-acetyltransferase/amino-acid N-acetyltransferase
MKKVKFIKGGVCAAKGFKASGVAAAIKYKDRKDVALIFSEEPCDAAAVFTTNKVAAAPVVYDRKAIKGGCIQAIVANSGCANACTGEQGMKDASLTALVASAELGIDKSRVLVASTGVIGRPLPMDRLLSGVKNAVENLGSKASDSMDAELAIMTTDTRPKEAAVEFMLSGKKARIGGICKGSGMIEPNMATMLGFLTTDVAISSGMLRKALLIAISKSFNRVVVDGDMSTNDSVFLMASGKAANKKITIPCEEFRIFTSALTEVCVSLARQMAVDGEGATKFVTVTVKGAKTRKDAERAARAVAKSPLAKTSWFGKDPNWGRVLAAVGYSGSHVIPEKTEVFFDGVWAYRIGEVADAKQLEKLEEVLKKDAFEIVVDLHLGKAVDTIYTCDFSLEYVHINADYTT